MRHQTQPNSWSCVATAFATVLDLDVHDVFRRVGHDGSEIVSGTTPQRRGFHVQELTDVAWQWGCTVTRIDLFPQSDGQPPWEINFPGGNRERFDRYVKTTQGVLLCRTRSGRGHALVNDQGYIYDPSPGCPPFPFDKIGQHDLFPFSYLIVGQRNV